MKKSIKILITSCVVAVGVGASFGGAFALFTKNANPTEFSIGTYTHTSSGSVTYKIGEVSNSIGNSKIDLDHKAFTLKAPLGGLYSNDIPAQDNVYGKFSVKATISSQLVDHVKWSVWIDNYEENTYWGSWDKVGDELPARKLTDDNVTLAAVETTVSHYLSVEAVANPVLAEKAEEQVGQVACVYFELTDLSEETFLTYAESTVKFDFTFDEPEGADIPLILGDHSAWSESALEYRMVPNIKSSYFEWQYEGLSEFTKFYIKDERHNGEDVTTYYVKAKHDADRDEDGNVVVDSEKTYSVYYKGSDGETGDRNVMVFGGEDGTVIYQE